MKTGAGSSYTAQALTLSLNLKAAILTSCSRSRAKMERLHNTDPVANWAKILNPDPNSIYLDPQHQCCGAGPFLTGSGSGSDQKVPAPTKKYWLRTAPAPQHCTTLLSMIHFLQNNCVLGYDSSVFKRFLTVSRILTCRRIKDDICLLVLFSLYKNMQVPLRKIVMKIYKYVNFKET